MKITDIRWTVLAGNFDWTVVRIDTDWPEPVIHDGYLHFTGQPGLGIDLDEDVARRHLMPGETWFA